MGFVKVASKKYFESEDILGVEANGKKIMLAKLNGNFYAIGDVCTHRGCHLSEGTIMGEMIECPCHRSVFDIKTGKVVKAPAKKPEPKYGVKIEGEDILVNV